jgi:hypothetical protein
MIPKSGNRFSEKIMRKKHISAGMRSGAELLPRRCIFDREGCADYFAFS